MWLRPLHTLSDTTSGLEGGQKETDLRVILVQYSSLLFSPAPLTLLRFPQSPTGGLLAKNEGISMLAEFSVINPVCHASVPVSPSLPLSTHPSLSLHLHIHLSRPQVAELICVELMEKKAASGDIH